jgi:hypothetical protein
MTVTDVDVVHKEWDRSIVAARQLTIGELPIGDESS